MAFRELTMIEVREMLRRWQAGQGIRAIARDTGFDRKTVRRYIASATSLGVTATDELTDDVVHGVADAVQARGAVDPSEQREELAKRREEIRGWLFKDELRLTKVHRRLEKKSVHVSYATLRRFVIDEFGWGQPPVTVRLPDPPAGQEAQLDFGEMGRIYDPETGRERRLHALIVTLSHSRHQFVWPTFFQTTQAVIEGLEAAWEFFGGVVQRVLLDNARCMIDTANPYTPKVQQVFEEYSQMRGFFVDTARVRSPKDKPRVERQVPYVRQDWFRGESFMGLEHAREDARRWCLEDAGRRVHGTTGCVPIEVFEQVERAALQPAPSEAWDVPTWSKAKVHRDCHIQVGRALYSIPWLHRGKYVRVRVDSSTMRAYLGTELVKVHPRVGPCKRSTDPADYPTGQDKYTQRDVAELHAKARELGPSIAEYTHRLLDSAMPWTRMRQVYQLQRLCERYGADRVDVLCERALSFDVVEVPRIANMLQSTKRFEELAEATGTLRPLPTGRFARSSSAFRTTQPSTGGES